MRIVILCLMMLTSYEVGAHEMTPTYPKLERSHVRGVYKSTLQIFNKRKDVEYYEIGVFDKKFKPIPFVTSYKVIHLKYLGHMTFDVYIREKDKRKAFYVCSRSKLRTESITKAAISSRICSKFK
jgi:hypothetical protein